MPTGRSLGCVRLGATGIEVLVEQGHPCCGIICHCIGSTEKGLPGLYKGPSFIHPTAKSFL